MIEGRQKAAGVGGDFLEDDGHIPRGLEAGSGRFRGLRLGVCRGGKEQDGQPHCFNLSRGTNQRPIKRGRWDLRVAGYETIRRPEEVVAGVERAARRWVRRSPCQFRWWCR